MFALLLFVAGVSASSIPTGASSHSLIFAVHQNNLDLLEKVLLDVSDPDSPKYGQHLSFSEVGELTRDYAALSNVQKWLRENLPSNITSTCVETPHGDFITCQAPVETWASQFATDFSHADHTRTIAIPNNLKNDIVGIFHGNLLPNEDPSKANLMRSTSYHTKRATNPQAEGYCTPALLTKTYNITSTGNGMGSQSVFETGQYGSASDLRKFQAKYSLPHGTVTKQVGTMWDDGTCKYLSDECGEANLDVQYITAIGQQVPTWFWGNDKDTTFAAWITAVSSTRDGPLVHSVSYGQLESETDDGSRTTFSTTVQKLGVQGISVLVSSGDDGVANPAARASSGLCGYTPQWPAVCPWVTTVGATQGPEEFKPEEVCSSSNTNTFITSGGGFSVKFPTPSYQSDVVTTFLATENNSLGKGYNAKGRGYPDVALIGHLYPIFNGGELTYKDGTSASTPVMAAIISLVNAERLAQKKSSVGFANPALYKWANNPAIFHDITEGKNNCCAGGWQGSTVVCCPENGFYAVKGWDPASGLGSVNVGNMLNVWSALP